MARRRKTVAQHARLGSPSTLRQLLIIVAVGLAVVLVAGASTLAYTAYGLFSNITEEAVELEDDVAQPPSIGAFEGPFDVLLVGTDECEPELVDLIGEDRCNGADAAGRLNDVNMLVHVSDSPRRVTVVSFPRDLQVSIPSCKAEDGSQTAGGRESLNAAYGYGGLTCVAKTISQLSGIAIPFAAKVSFGNVIAITEAIGGVEVCIGNEGIRDRHTGIDWPAGPRTVSGGEALQFLRTRHGLVGESDLSRISNQQQYMSSLVRKITDDATLSDPATLLRLATAASQNITPSESLTNPLRIVQLALAAKDVPLDDITFVQFPVFDDPANSNHVIADTDAATALWEAIETNQPLEVTGNAGSGVIEASPAPTQPPVESPAPETSASSTPAPTDVAVELPSNVPGSKADEPTCSAGNLR
jgi:LCP family protein required for cell wall assembly